MRIKRIQAKVGEMAKRAASDKKVLFILLGMGLGIGLVFPYIAMPFVDPKSTGADIAFRLACVAAGLALGWMCDMLVSRFTENRLMSVLADASAALGISVHETKGLEGLSEEISRVFGDVQLLIEKMKHANTNIRMVSAEVLAATEEQASGAAEQAAAVTETSATVEELAQTSSQIADNASSVVRVAEKTLSSAEEGMTAVANTAAGIEEIRESTMQSSDRILALGERSQEIGRVLSIIDEIAEQTKILALNAAIEAARAGDAGKGFSVVAEEIRKLADSVTESTQEISRVVREIQASTSALIMQTEKAARKVEEGQELAKNTQSSLEKIVSQVEETTDAAKQISIATQQQRTASDQVVISMREVALVSQQAAEVSRQITAAITELNKLADSMSR